MLRAWQGSSSLIRIANIEDGSYPHFTDEKGDSESLRHLRKVTQLASSRMSGQMGVWPWAQSFTLGLSGCWDGVGWGMRGWGGWGGRSCLWQWQILVTFSCPRQPHLMAHIGKLSPTEGHSPLEWQSFLTPWAFPHTGVGALPPLLVVLFPALEMVEDDSGRYSQFLQSLEMVPLNSPHPSYPGSPPQKAIGPSTIEISIPNLRQALNICYTLKGTMGLN